MIIWPHLSLNKFLSEEYVASTLSMKEHVLAKCWKILPAYMESYRVLIFVREVLTEFYVMCFNR